MLFLTLQNKLSTDALDALMERMRLKNDKIRENVSMISCHIPMIDARSFVRFHPIDSANVSQRMRMNFIQRSRRIVKKNSRRVKSSAHARRQRVKLRLMLMQKGECPYFAPVSYSHKYLLTIVAAEMLTRNVSSRIKRPGSGTRKRKTAKTVLLVSEGGAALLVVALQEEVVVAVSSIPAIAC